MLSTKDYFKQFFNKASSKRKLYVYLFCLFISIFFWWLNALSSNYSTNISFNVDYINFPKNKVVLNSLPQQIDIKIRGLGFDLMGYKFRIKNPAVTIDLTKLNNNEEHKIVNQSLYTKSFQSYISSQLGDHIEIQEIYPDSIYFELDEKIEKLLPVTPKTTITYDKQFQLFGKILLKPASVKVVGPRSVLDTMSEIYTKNLILKELNKTTTGVLMFSNEYEKQHLVFNPQQVAIYIPIEKYTESTKKVKLIPINVPSNITLKTIPGEVEVKFRIPLSKISVLEDAIFTAVVDYEQVDKKFNYKLKVMLTNHPDFIQSITLNPTKVEYILKKNE